MLEVLSDIGGSSACFCRPKAGKHMRPDHRLDHRYRTTPRTLGAEPIRAISVVEAISVVIPPLDNPEHQLPN